MLSPHTDQTFAWTDVSAGVAGTVAICLAFLGVGFLIYEFNMRDYFRERRNDGTVYTQMVEDVISGTYDTVPDDVGGSKKTEMTISAPVNNDFIVNGTSTTRAAQVDMQ